MKKIKCLVIGDDEVGKTSLLISYTTNTFSGEYVPTVFESCSSIVTFDNQSIDLQIWDTSTKGNYKQVIPILYPIVDIIIVCFSLVSPISFGNVEKVWIPEIKSNCPNTPYILVGMKSDFRANTSQIIISKEEGERLMKKIGARCYIECSSLNMFQVKDVFENVIKIVLYKNQEEKNAKSNCLIF